MSRALMIAPVTVLALFGAACSSDDGSGSAGDGISATLTDFAIDLGETSAPAGPVTFDITNHGATVHEFEVLRTDTGADALPVDSGVVQTSADGIEIVDEVEEIAPGTGTVCPSSCTRGRTPSSATSRDTTSRGCSRRSLRSSASGRLSLFLSTPPQRMTCRSA